VNKYSSKGKEFIVSRARAANAIINTEESMITKYMRYLYKVTVIFTLTGRILSPQAYIELFSSDLRGLGAHSLPNKYIAADTAKINKKTTMDSIIESLRLLRPLRLFQPDEAREI